jgi:hypothetical protein
MWYALDGERGELLGELRSPGPPPKLGYKDVNGTEVESCVEVVVITDPALIAQARADLQAGRIPDLEQPVEDAPLTRRPNLREAGPA